MTTTPKDNGGPAFPQPNHLIETDHGRMNARDWMEDSGLTMRDYFAGQALPAALAKCLKSDKWMVKFSENPHDALMDPASLAFASADAMIAARSK